MPIYLHTASLIIDKEAVKAKYKGGLIQFRKDHMTGIQCQEDQELFIIAAHRTEELDITSLTSKGFLYNDENPYSNDFTIYQRPGGFLWEVDWVDANGVYVWHTKCSEAHKKEVERIYNMEVKEVERLMKKGVDVFQTIF